MISPGKLEIAWWQFHTAHPIVYRHIYRFACEWMLTGRSLCSIQLLYERVRWQLVIEGYSKGKDGFKLNNNHTPFYARLLVSEPGFENFLRLRRLRIPCSFGPDNKELPPGEHVA